ncbi:type I-E CRISPR-associated protein Cas6/Cse3/CasE [Corynebacterium mendelii]|uniref:Type I-E CRISPR-associated protein Cas6/Cse3/CasE n=1 Tax=Corynebacterium mendelii TaxID=2765362 RepID=A0A939E0N7_9CORY|nr:type I-E CRISPR-associated protein Cas6/Cse3/CasE [Corynebacterium mendelii]MBN9644276.1 type I-E CRISPR-associated protein Cas6/Cse3/CasE [Corynebacterium mendelii]
MFLNRRRRGTAKLVGSRQAMHAAVMGAFSPVALESDPGRILWRLDRGRESLSLYISSPTKPSFDHLQEQAGWGNEVTWATRSLDPLLDQLREGQRYRFRLAANPVRSSSSAGKQKRIHHVTADQQLAWMVNKSSAIGMGLCSVETKNSPAGPIIPPDTFATPELKRVLAELSPSAVVTERRLEVFGRQKRRVTISVVQFDGIMTVTDAPALRRAMVDGVGRAKAYGCGLLTLSAIPD